MKITVGMFYDAYASVKSWVSGSDAVARPFVRDIPGTSNAGVGERSVGNLEAVEIYAGAAAMPGRRKLRVRCVGNDTVYVGPAGVTALNGFPVLPGERFEMDIDPRSALQIYGIAGSGTQKIRVMEEV
jgi:hypothetical protein